MKKCQSSREWRGILVLAALCASCGGGSTGGTVTGTASSQASSATPTLLQPGDLSYLGAFRLPGGDERPQTFAYGGNAMTYNPDGDPSGAGDGFPGSLFILGHDRLPYGELADGGQVAEVAIPAPAVSRSAAGLSEGSMLQGFHEVSGGLFAGLDEIPRVGLQYLSHPGTGPKIHMAWGQHFQEERRASHALFSPTLSNPRPQGAWFIGDESLYSVNGYLFEIPKLWADTNLQGRYLATGRYRDGGWSGQGPSLFAYVPWTDSGGTLAPAGSSLPRTVLLRYRNSYASEDVVSGSLRGYQHADEWEGGAWLTTASGKTAVVFAGTKGVGAKYWYGWAHPSGPNQPCVETEFLGQFPLCRLANGSPCPAEDLEGCSGHSDFRGWWSARFEAQIIFYDPAALAGVASGASPAEQPQPYSTMSLDGHLLLSAPEREVPMVGSGAQRRFRIGDLAFDRARGLLYVLELYADEAKPVVHVYRVS
jgi:hypothetical protein